MSPDRVTQYWHAQQVFEQATREAEALVALVTKAAQDLQQWPNVVVENSGYDFPAELRFLPTYPRIDGVQWPSLAKLASTLVKWQNANFRLQQAWALVPPDLRRGLQPPPFHLTVAGPVGQLSGH
jgi:hypothetical protein